MYETRFDRRVDADHFNEVMESPQSGLVAGDPSKQWAAGTQQS